LAVVWCADDFDLVSLHKVFRFKCLVGCSCNVHPVAFFVFLPLISECDGVSVSVVW
jgi:hypothetical protein